MDDHSGRARSPSAPQDPQSGGARPPAEPIDPLAALCVAHGPVNSVGHFPTGTIFGDWRLTAFIGRGGNGEVYCAEHVTLGTSAAVKVLIREEERAKVRFIREAKLLSTLKSDAFPRFFAYGEANGHSYLAMELLEPGDLPTGERAIARFMLNVCDAVAELHAHGYVHRDIKPSNILWRTGITGVPPVAVPVLSDLGLVKDVSKSDAERPTSDVTIGGVGTPGYSAPEQMERGEATVASDIHALGVLADRCFDGKPPRPWARIIQRATSSIPAHRYPSVAALAQAIHSRHRIRHLVIACVIVVAVIVVTWICILWGRGKTDSVQDVHGIRREIQEMKTEQFQRELSQGWAEMIKELRKLCERGIWHRERIDRYKDFWAKGNLDHQAEEKSQLRQDVELLTRDWKVAKERHAEKIRVWNKQAEKLGLAPPTPPEEYSKLRGNLEYVLGSRLVIDCMQL